MFVSTNEQIAEIIASAKTVAITGISDNSIRPSYEIMKFWLGRGVRVIPVNPQLAGQKVHGVGVKSSLSEINFPIDIVDVFRNSRHLMDVVREILPLGIGCLWTQLGVRDRAAEALAHRNGTTLVIDKCPAIETPKLMRVGLL